MVNKNLIFDCPFAAHTHRVRAPDHWKAVTATLVAVGISVAVKTAARSITSNAARHCLGYHRLFHGHVHAF